MVDSILKNTPFPSIHEVWRLPKSTDVRFIAEWVLTCVISVPSGIAIGEAKQDTYVLSDISERESKVMDIHKGLARVCCLRSDTVKVGRSPIHLRSVFSSSVLTQIAVRATHLEEDARNRYRELGVTTSSTVRSAGRECDV